MLHEGVAVLTVRTRVRPIVEFDRGADVGGAGIAEHEVQVLRGDGVEGAVEGGAPHLGRGMDHIGEPHLGEDRVPIVGGRVEGLRKVALAGAQQMLARAVARRL